MKTDGGTRKGTHDRTQTRATRIAAFARRNTTNHTHSPDGTRAMAQATPRSPRTLIAACSVPCAGEATADWSPLALPGTHAGTALLPAPFLDPIMGDYDEDDEDDDFFDDDSEGGGDEAAEEDDDFLDDEEEADVDEDDGSDDDDDDL